MRPFAALVARLVLGSIMTVYGWRKIFPHGSLYSFVHAVAHMGLPSWLGYVAAFTEFFGGVFLILGLLTPIAAAGMVIDMTVAILKVHLHRGLTGAQGVDFPLSLFALALILLAVGPGYLALDMLLFRQR